jgi:hypothetical protein
MFKSVCVLKPSLDFAALPTTPFNRTACESPVSASRRSLARLSFDQARPSLPISFFSFLSVRCSSNKAALDLHIKHSVASFKDIQSNYLNNSRTCNNRRGFGLLFGLHLAPRTFSIDIHTYKQYRRQSPPPTLCSLPNLLRPSASKRPSHCRTSEQSATFVRFDLPNFFRWILSFFIFKQSLTVCRTHSMSVESPSSHLRIATKPLSLSLSPLLAFI